MQSDRIRAERGTLLADRYELLERLGRGGMGEVWSARDRLLHRRVALKLLLVDEAVPADLPARFEREAVAAAQINHPNVVALFDRGVHGDVPFLVMERVDGMPLSTLIKSTGVLPLVRALELAEQICAALEATHGAGVVHYDIKPRNVMITTAGTAKVVDFGIAGFLRAQQLSVVRSSHLAPAATLEYAAPEQITAERGDARSDLYALGGVLFTMLTGHAPFTGPNAWAVMAAKIGGDAPRLEQVRPGVPAALAHLVARLLEREPAARPQTASEVRQLLRQLHAETGEDGESESLLGTTLVDERFAQLYAPAAPAASAAAAAAPSAPAAPDRPDPPGAGATGGGPRQLPAGTGLFTGRASELKALLALAERARIGGEPGTVVISAIDGMGGVGKTALAVHAAHRLSEHFPDGQLFLDLNGYAADVPPREPADALAALLSGLGVSAQAIPADTDARAALYRERLSGTRTLILLDNAANEAQVQPLLPAAETCLVLVTSRRRLKSLDDAWPLAVDLLPPEQAVELLSRAARLEPGKADPALLEHVAALCEYLPLALVIAASLVRTGGPSWTLERVAERLAAKPETKEPELAAFGDDARNLSAVFDLSYRALSADRQGLYRRLALIPGPTVDAYAAAALLESDPQTAGGLLEALADHSLLTETARGRYRAHDLIRAHARTLAAQVDAESEREAALDRLLVYYAHTAQGASIPIARYPRPASDGPAPAHAPALAEQDAARAWLHAEYPNLDAAHTFARAHAPDTPALADHAVDLAAGLAEILRADGIWAHAVELHEHAAQSAERSGRPAARAAALTDLGIARRLTGDMTGAEDALSRALEIFDAAGHRIGQANALTELASVRHMIGDFNASSEVLSRALEIYRETGNRAGEADALADLGGVRQYTGDLPGADDVLARALEIYRELGHRGGQANALTYLGIVRRQAKELPEAGDALARALEIYRELGSPFGAAAALTELGDVRRLTGDLAAAGEAQREALEFYRETGHRGAEAWALNHYAATVAATGDRPQALALYQQALAANRELDKPDDEALSLEGIADHHLAAGDPRRSAEHLNQALEIYRNLGMLADAERVRARLAENTDAQHQVSTED